MRTLMSDSKYVHTNVSLPIHLPHPPTSYQHDEQNKQNYSFQSDYRFIDPSIHSANQLDGWLDLDGWLAGEMSWWLFFWFLWWLWWDDGRDNSKVRYFVWEGEGYANGLWWCETEPILLPLLAERYLAFWCSHAQFSYRSKCFFSSICYPISLPFSLSKTA